MLQKNANRVGLLLQEDGPRPSHYRGGKNFAFFSLSLALAVLLLAGGGLERFDEPAISMAGQHKVQPSTRKTLPIPSSRTWLPMRAARAPFFAVPTSAAAGAAVEKVTELHPESSFRGADIAGRRGIMAWIAVSTAATVQAMLGVSPAKAARARAATELAIEVAALNQLVVILGEATQTAKEKAVAASGKIQTVAGPGSLLKAGSTGGPAVVAEKAAEEVAARAEAVSVLAEKIVDSARKVQLARASAIAEIEMSGAEANMKKLDAATSAATTVSVEIQGARLEMSKAKAYAVAAANAVPKIFAEQEKKSSATSTEKKGVSNAAASVAAVAAFKADEALGRALKTVQAAQKTFQDALP